MKASYVRAATPGEVWTWLTALRARTLVFDVEPLVAFWDTDQGVLADGIAAVLAGVVGVGADSVLFATNSTRRPPKPPQAAQAAVGYLASARKPLRVTAYRDLPAQEPSSAIKSPPTASWPGASATRSCTTHPSCPAFHWAHA